MTEQDILRLRDLAEAGQVQFKECIVNKDDKYDLGCEMVTFSNSRGGRLIIGINDKSGEINALSYQELQETSNLLTNIASENVIPNVLIDVENANYFLPYKGASSGVRRALEYDPNAILSNGVDQREITHSANEFVITNPRKGYQANGQDNLVTDQVSSETDQVPLKVKLYKKQIDIRNFCSIPRTAKEILERAGVTNHFYNRTKYIYDLVESGVLERTIPDKPNDPNQKYRSKQ